MPRKFATTVPDNAAVRWTQRAARPFRRSSALFDVNRRNVARTAVEEKAAALSRNGNIRAHKELRILEIKYPTSLVQFVF